MSRAVEYTPTVLVADRAIKAVDALQALDARVVGSTDGESQSRADAFADLSDAICAVLGQLLVSGQVAGTEVLGIARRAAERKGLPGLESVVLSAFIAAAQNGATAEAIATASYLGRPNVLGRLAGGARRVPLADPVSLVIGSVSLAELVGAIGSSGGSVGALSNALRLLAARNDGTDDDQTLPAVAFACADAFVAALTVRKAVNENNIDPNDAAALGGAMNTAVSAWRGAAAQVVNGKAIVTALRIAGVRDDTVPPPDPGAVPAGLGPRTRRGLPSSGPAIAGLAGLPVPARVTAAAPAWITVSGRSAEFHPPRELRPFALPEPVDRGGEDPFRDRAAATADLIAAVTSRMLVPGPGAGPQLHVLTGQPIGPTGQPIGPSPVQAAALAEATLVEARTLKVDTSQVTIAELIDVLIGRRG